MGLFNFGSSYNKPGPGVSKDEEPKAAPIRFFEIYFRKFSKLVQVNLIFLIPAVIAAFLIAVLYLFFDHIVLKIPVGGTSISIDVWGMYVVPLPLVLLSPFLAGMTVITRNFSREEHAFVWSDFWDSVKANWKLFLANGVVVYLVYFVLSFALIHYYNNALYQPFYYVPFWVCVVIAFLFIFAQYYLPVMFVTFDLKFGQMYRNALIFTLAGFARNILLTVILGALLLLIIGVIPIMPLTVLILVLFFAFAAFSLVSFLINFTVYPVVDRYMIQPYNKKLEDEKKASLGPDSLPEEEEETEEEETEEEQPEENEDQYVYINGRLVKQSKVKSSEEEDTE